MSSGHFLSAIDHNSDVYDCSSFASSAPSGIITNMMKFFTFSQEIGSLTISLYVFGYCLGPLAWGPLSEEVRGSAIRSLAAVVLMYCIPYSMDADLCSLLGSYSTLVSKSAARYRKTRRLFSSSACSVVSSLPFPLQTPGTLFHSALYITSYITHTQISRHQCRHLGHMGCRYAWQSNGTFYGGAICGACTRPNCRRVH